MPFAPHKPRFIAVFIACAVAPWGALAHPRRDARTSAPTPRPPGRAAVSGTGQAARPQGARKGDTKAREARERQLAVAAVLEAADSARTFDDPLYSARVQTLAADALWPTDEQRARSLFRRAWEAATASDLAEMREEADSERGDAAPHHFTDAREEVLTAAARREPPLAESFFLELSKSQTELGADLRRSAETSYSAGPFEGISVGSWQRLQLARRLLDGGDPVRAAEIVAPVISEGAGIDLVRFLLELRTRSPLPADGLYLRLLARTRIDASSDVNDVLRLSSYVISPNLLLTVDRRGSVEMSNVTYARASGEAPAPPPTPRVRAAFFDAAAAVLLRPVAPHAPDGGQWEGRLLGPYFAIGRLLPFFEREAPRHAPELHARLQALAADIAEESRERLAAQMSVEKVTPDNPVDRLGQQLDAISKTEEGPARDLLRFRAVERAARLKMWDRARRIAEAITQTELRHRALRLVTTHKLLSLREAYAEMEEEDFESAARFVREADAPAVALALGMSQAAELAARRDRRARAVELLGQASAYAAEAPPGSEQRAVAYAVVTTSAARVDAARAWETLAEFVRAANAFDQYVGDEVSFEADADREALGGDEFSALRMELSKYGLMKVFAAVTPGGLARAFEQARTLEGKEARAYALIAVARARLGAGAAGVRRAGEKK